MTEHVTTNGVYRTVEQLIGKLTGGGHVKLALLLEHRLHKVAWTSGSELLDELRKVLVKALSADDAASTLPRKEIDDVLDAIDALQKEPT